MPTETAVKAAFRARSFGGLERSSFEAVGVTLLEVGSANLDLPMASIVSTSSMLGASPSRRKGSR